jgi:hypothetical protein
MIIDLILFFSDMRSVLIFIFLFANYHLIFSQDIVDSTVSKLKTYTDLYPTERIYIQTDKPYYGVDEFVYFKVYVYTDRQHLNERSGNVLYVNLLDKNNRPLLKKKLEIKNNGAAGHFYLPTELEKGLYKIGAYTNWSRNFDDTFYEKVFDNHYRQFFLTN